MGSEMCIRDSVYTDDQIDGDSAIIGLGGYLFWEFGLYTLFTNFRFIGSFFCFIFLGGH